MTLSNRLSTKLLLSLCSVITLALGILVFVVSRQSSRVAEAQATQTATEMAGLAAERIHARLEEAMVPARTIAQAFKAQRLAGTLERRSADAVMRQVFEESPQLAGVWSIWEPNAFDGKDAKYANTPGTDATGRYLSYWNRASGSTVMEAAADYEKAGANDFYALPKKSLQEVLLDPYYYTTAAGKTLLLTSAIVPIVIDGKFMGVVGADFTLEQVQADLAEVKPFETGHALLASHNAAFVAHPKAELLGKPIGTAPFAALMGDSLSSGKGRIGRVHSDVLGAEAIEVVVPFKVGKSTTPWALAVFAPLDKVLAPAAELRTFTLALGVLALVALALAVLAVIRRITRPLERISAVA
ncbi:hypothetical protein FGE12_18225, partial [Aggregicoccus sp. 17bor-14]|uniref:PDC sensor domain-containing protein n=1 Tax=Myxococcaceae TaxID=31 RepID=UPI0012EFE3D5